MWAAFTKIFCKETVAKMAATELAEAEWQLLEACTDQEYSASRITFEQTRTKRLRSVLRDMAKQTGETA